VPQHTKYCGTHRRQGIPHAEHGDVIVTIKDQKVDVAVTKPAEAPSRSSQGRRTGLAGPGAHAVE
jgi:hypothetical protein